MKELRIAFEGGGSKTRILLADTEHNVLARSYGGYANAMYIDGSTFARVVRELLEPVRARVDEIGGSVSAVGITGPISTRVVKEVMEDIFGELEFIHVGEADLALAQYDLDVGIALIAGTGCMCLGQNERGRRWSCGGFGPQFGDEGSGYWIGREAIAAAMRTRDGRGQAIFLAKKMVDFFRMSRTRFYASYRNCTWEGRYFPPRVAAFAPEVFDAARQGDTEAQRICQEAGRALGELVTATARNARIKRQPMPLVMTGGVFNASDLILPPLEEALRASEFAFDIFPPVPEPTEVILKVIEKRRRRKKNRVSGQVL